MPLNKRTRAQLSASP